MQSGRCVLPMLLLPLMWLGSAAQSTKARENAPGLFEKGMGALQGSNAARSSANAIDYFRRSAELGFAPAQVVLGYFYETGHIVTTDPQAALEWYKKAALQDDPLAQWLVGRVIYAGLVPPRDLNEAQTWLEKSASHGDPFAEYLLGKNRSGAQRLRASSQRLPAVRRARATTGATRTCEVASRWRGRAPRLFQSLRLAAHEF